tara:strand:+ start:6265 stop:7137 length:873 start_codon:yes stop_codon:yes gene_type:complete
MDNDTKNYTIEQLSNYICFLKIKEISKPYTTLKDVCKITLKNSDKIDKIKVYNLLSKKIENIYFSEIEEITVHGIDNNNIEINLGYIDTINSDLNDCSLEYISKDELEDYYLKNEVYLVNSEKNIFNICKKFEFTVRDYEIKANTISNVDNIQNVWRKTIKVKIDENVNELNEIKNEADDEEDIEDINSIIEMFNDTITEIDLSDCKNLIDVIDTYPPLLLPLPGEFSSIKDDINSFSDNTLDAALSLIKTMTFNELQEIYDEVSEIKDTNYVVTKVIYKIKEILDKANQ